MTQNTQCSIVLRGLFSSFPIKNMAKPNLVIMELLLDTLGLLGGAWSRAGLFVLDTNIFVASLKKMVMGHVGINVQTFRSLMNTF